MEQPLNIANKNVNGWGNTEPVRIVKKFFILYQYALNAMNNFVRGLVKKNFSGLKKSVLFVARHFWYWLISLIVIRFVVGNVE